MPLWRVGLTGGRLIKPPGFARIDESGVPSQKRLDARSVACMSRHSKLKALIAMKGSPRDENANGHNHGQSRPVQLAICWHPAV